MNYTGKQYVLQCKKVRVTMRSSKSYKVYKVSATMANSKSYNGKK